MKADILGLLLGFIANCVSNPALRRHTKPLLVLISLCISAQALSASDTETAPPDLRELAQHVEQLKQQAVDFNRDLLLLEDATVPADRRVTVFLSESPGLQMTVQSAEVQIDPDVSVRHQYLPAEGNAISNGGAHRLYMGAVPPGRHVLSASLSAQDVNGNPRHFASKISFRGGQGSKTLELHLDGSGPDDAELVIHESN